MELIKIQLENFRQFYGVQEIEFASGEKNITIIFGVNGKGKTGIFRALIFGLYGKTHLPQDNKQDKIHLINWNALKENSPTSASVTVTFKNNGQIYTIKRVLKGCQFKEDVIEEEQSVELYLTSNSGDMSALPITDRTEISSIINEILHEEVKDFFLFDGEKIDALAKTNTEVKKEVKTAIVNLLQIDKLERAVKITNDLWSKEDRNIRNNISNMNIASKGDEKEAIEQEIKVIEEKLQLKQENIASCNSEIYYIREKLEENEEVRQLHQKISEFEMQYRTQNETLRMAKKMLKDSYFNQGHKLLLQDYYKKIDNYLKQVLVNQKDMVGIELIEKSLNDMTCACCHTDLHQMQEALSHIKQLQRNYKRSELTPLITKITSSISDFEMIQDEKKKGLEQELRNVRNIKNELEALGRKRDDLKARARSYSQNEANLRALEASLEEKEQIVEQFKQEVNRLEGQIIERTKTLTEVEREYAELLKQNKETEYDAKRLAYVKQLGIHLEQIFTEYSDDMRERLMIKATEIFKQLIDGKDKELINKIVINNKYELEIYNWQNKNATQDISQGQRQIVALSFITALAQIAGGDKKNIDFPLFMDTPFGRISGNNRDNLIVNIPSLISQWILLLTDTEFSIQEEMNFKMSGKLGKWYRLEQIELGYTKIQPIQLEDQMATRR